METGPLARAVIAYAAGQGDYKDLIDRSLSQLHVPFEAMYSTVGRTLARAIESELVAHWMEEFYIRLLTQIKNGDQRMFNNIYWEPDSWPQQANGFGLTEAPRGSLAHYVDIENKKIKNYQMVVPTTWNASPRDVRGQRSAFEASLPGTPVHDSEAPLEIIRTIHSFDPCMACSVHLYDEEGKHIHQFDTM